MGTSSGRTRRSLYPQQQLARWTNLLCSFAARHIHDTSPRDQTATVSVEDEDVFEYANAWCLVSAVPLRGELP
jgi:hypothetical protein